MQATACDSESGSFPCGKLSEALLGEITIFFRDQPLPGAGCPKGNSIFWIKWEFSGGERRGMVLGSQRLGSSGHSDCS